MRRLESLLAASSIFLLLAALSAAEDGLTFGSPGFSPTRLDRAGRLIEDWGPLRVALVGEDMPPAGEMILEAVKLDGVIPAATARAERGPFALSLTAFRSPAWPAGLDVLTVRVEERSGKEAGCRLSLDLPEGARIGNRTVSLGGRTVLALPSRPATDERMRDWGYCDEAVPLPGWARPEGNCDPAFRNIRAGMGGVPIAYLFSIGQKGSSTVVLGFCESHWAQSGQRLLVCKVEGAPSQAVDPVARWGRHKPGALLFKGRDENGDGRLEVAVIPAPGSPDQNPILNAIWVFPPDRPPDLDRVIAGKLNALSTFYVDSGGEKDQSLYPPGKLEFPLKLAARGSQELTFLLACPGGSAPVPDRTGWTAEALRRAAREVWRDWRER